MIAMQTSQVEDLWITVAILTALLMLCFVLGVRNDRRWKKTLERERARQVTEDWTAGETLAKIERLSFPEVRRYEVTVTDWGPDFTGEDGTLPRFRWVVSDAEQPLRRALGTEDLDSPNYLMLGNERSSEEAWWAALRWVEMQQNPPIQVVVS